MKNLTFLLLTFLPLIGSAQSWAPVGAKWYYTQPGPGNNPYYDYTLYEVTKDTVVNGKRASFIESPHGTEIMYQDEQEVFYYQDGSFHKVFDFGAAEGDTVTFEIRSYARENSTELDTILSVQGVLQEVSTVNGSSRPLNQYVFKYIPLPDMEHLVWGGNVYVEEVGYVGEFMEFIRPPTTGSDAGLRCFQSPALSFTGTWWAMQNKPCDYASRTGIHEATEPQPLTIRQEGTWLYLNLEEPGGQYRILDATGRAVAAGQVQGQRIHTGQLSGGVYFLTLGQEGEVFTGKFMKQ